MKTFVFLDSKHVKPNRKCHEVKNVWHHIRTDYVGTLSDSRFPNWSRSTNGHKCNNFISSCLLSRRWRNGCWTNHQVIHPVWWITWGSGKLRIVAINNFVLFHGASRLNCRSYICLICSRCCTEVPVRYWLNCYSLYRYWWSKSRLEQKKKRQ